MRQRPLNPVDIAIIAHLRVDGRRAFTSFAKDLGISEASVRQRVARPVSSKAAQIVAGDPVESVAAALAELPEVGFVSTRAGDVVLHLRVLQNSDEWSPSSSPAHA